MNYKKRNWISLCLALLLVFVLQTGNVSAQEDVVDVTEDSLETVTVEETTPELLEESVEESVVETPEVSEPEVTEELEVPEVPTAETFTGWDMEGENWVFYKDNVKAIGWHWLPVIEDGTLQIKEHAWKYFDADGVNVDQFYYEDGKAYLSLESPYVTYYKGWWTDPANGHSYYFRLDTGSRVDGWQFIDDNWYFFRYNTGTLATGWQYIDGAWYYLGEDGVKTGEGWYWIDLKDSEGNVVDKVWKYFDDDGKNVDQLYHENGGTWLSQAGPEKGYLKGWWTNPANGHTYYFRLGSGSMVTGWQYIDGYWRYFRASGTLAKGWQFLDGGWFYLRPTDGSQALGWQFVDGAWYYIDETTGRNDDGYETEVGPYGGENIYWFRSTGTLALGWQYVPTESFVPGEGVSNMWHYFTIHKGDSQGWHTIDGSIYYFDPIYRNMYTGVKSTGDGIYSFNKWNGNLETGAVKNFTNGKPFRQLYFYGPTQYELSNAWLNDADWEQQTRGQHLINYGLRFEDVPFWWYGHDLANHIGVYCSGAAYDILTTFGIEFPGPTADNMPANYDPNYKYNGFNTYDLGYAMVNDQLNYHVGEFYFGGNLDLLQAGDVFFGYDPYYSYYHSDNNWANHTTMYAGQNNGVHYLLHSASRHGYSIEPVSEVTYNWGYGLRPLAKRLYQLTPKERVLRGSLFFA